VSEAIALDHENGVRDSPFGSMFGVLRQAGQAFLGSTNQDKGNSDVNTDRSRFKKVTARTKEHKKGADAQIKKASMMAEDDRSTGKALSGNANGNANMDTGSHTATEVLYHHARSSRGHNEFEKPHARLVSHGNDAIEHYPSINDTQPIRRTCEYSDRGCKSMCRWLKLSGDELNQDRPSMKCPMVERPFAGCGYVPSELRAADFDTEFDEIDCAVALIRTNVLVEDVGNYVDQLDDCLGAISPQVNSTCRMGLELLRGEVMDWRQEEVLKVKARNLGLRLRDANEQAQQALDSKTHQQDAIDLLARLLAEAEELPGHYLAENVQQSRVLLDRLSPIPVVRAELREAIAAGEQAMEDQSKLRLGEASVWLGSVLPKAKQVDVGPAVQEGEDVLRRLNVLRSAMQALNLGSFTANISLNTKSNIAESISSLNQSIVFARSVGVKVGLRKAKTLLGKLVAVETAIEATVEATSLAEMILNTPRQKSSRNLRGAADRLNTTIFHSQVLGLANHRSTALAVQSLDSIEYIKNARLALHRAIKHAENVIAVNGSALSDDAEELAISEIEPAVDWGNDVGLVNGLPYARDLDVQLKAIEAAKEQMMKALATGNASYIAKTEEDKGIRTLAAAVAVEAQVNITGGADVAQELLKLLATRKVSRSALETAVTMANESLQTQSDETKAIIALNASILEAQASGLDDAVAVASAQLSQLQAFAEARHNLNRALQRTTPAPAMPHIVEIVDTEVSGEFNRTGLKVVALPAVPGAVDDGDDDFDEHIEVLVNAISGSKSRGEVDPNQQERLVHMRTMKATYFALQDAVTAGNSSLSANVGVSQSIAALSAVLRQADNIGLKLGVRKATVLLRKLQEIEPARDELIAAVLQANVSINTFSGMDTALVRLSAAISKCKAMHLNDLVTKGEQTQNDLMQIRSAYSVLKAAITRGEIALKQQQGEEAAIQEIEEAIQLADKLKMHKQLEVAVVLLHELTHMNAEHQRLQAAMNPAPR